jgi:uncharacterized membrane protein
MLPSDAQRKTFSILALPDLTRAPSNTMSQRTFYLTACSSLITLIFLCLAWELRLAPIKPGGSWLVLKCVPLLLPLFGILNGRRYTYQWSSMLILLYFMEGLVRASSDSGTAQWLAIGETALSVTFFISTIGFLRHSRQPTRP